MHHFVALFRSLPLTPTHTKVPRTREQAYHARNRHFSLARESHAEMLVRQSSRHTPRV